MDSALPSHPVSGVVHTLHRGCIGGSCEHLWYRLPSRPRSAGGGRCVFSVPSYKPLNDSTVNSSFEGLSDIDVTGIPFIPWSTLSSVVLRAPLLSRPMCRTSRSSTDPTFNVPVADDILSDCRCARHTKCAAPIIIRCINLLFFFSDPT